MTLRDLMTPESLAAFDQLRSESMPDGSAMMAGYRQLRQEMVDTYPALAQWVELMENFRFEEARNPQLLQSLHEDGFIRCSPQSQRETSLVVDYEIISPRILDASRESGKPATEFNYTTAKFCCRCDELPVGSPLGRERDSPRLIDCEVFEIPMRATSDSFDDREKIHVVYLASLQDGKLEVLPVYIGIGTGEAFGTGPQRHPGVGRFRFFRYDAKDNMHCEFITCAQVRDWDASDVVSIPNVTAISEKVATLLLGRSSGDASFMCLSDPQVERHHSAWLSDNPQNHMEFQEVRLEKHRQTLPASSPQFPEIATDLGAVLFHAEDVYRHFVVAWMHPERLATGDALRIYYRQLPAFRRQQYEVYRFRQDVFESSPTDPDALTIPRVLMDEDLRAQVHPAAIEMLEEWLRPQILSDLYGYGNHPELRLCIGLQACRLLMRSGIWMDAVRGAYRGRLFEVDISIQRLLRDQACA